MAQLSDDCFATGEALMTTAQALALIEERAVAVTDTVPIGLRAALGHTLAADIIADRNIPPFDNSAVDGYAFSFADFGPGPESSFAIVGRSAAGNPFRGTVGKGGAIRIFTGAVMPGSVDTVAMQEDCKTRGDTVRIPRGLKLGANRRRAGEDVKAGVKLLPKGHRLRPQDLGVIASLGRTALEVYRPLKVGVFSTGDEVHEPGAATAEGGIYDSNRFVAIALLEGLGCEVTDLGILKDDAATIRAAIAEAATKHDVLLTSGGVSVGEEDHVRSAIIALGKLHFWRLAIKPGRPLALGQIGRTPVIGLPGNPVAAMVTFLRFARPLILRLGGATETEPNLFHVRSDFAYSKKKDRREFVRARIEVAPDGTRIARKFERQGAGILTSLVATDGLVELPEEMTELAVGDTVDFLSFAEVTG